MKSLIIAFALLFSNCAIKVIGYKETGSTNITAFEKAGKIIVKNGTDREIVRITMYNHDYIGYQPGFPNGWMTHAADCKLCNKTKVLANINTNPFLQYNVPKDTLKNEY